MENTNETNGLTHIDVILDMSGSMGEDKQFKLKTIDGFNSFVADQQSVPGLCRMTVILFNKDIQVWFDNRPISEVPELTIENYVPKGGTALLDAIGITIDRKIARLEEQGINTRPSKNVLVIITDGQENESHKFNKEQIFQKITAAREAGWEIVFLGANQDAFEVSSSLGVSPSHVSNYTADVHGVTNAFAVSSRNLRMHRIKGATMAYSKEDRDLMSKGLKGLKNETSALENGAPTQIGRYYDYNSKDVLVKKIIDNIKATIGVTDETSEEVWAKKIQLLMKNEPPINDRS